MTKNFMPGIIPLRVGALKPFHPGHQIGLRCLDQQVIMVAHHYVGGNAPARLLTRFAQRLQPHFPIQVVGVNRSALVAARHHMVGGPSIFDSDLASHRGGILPFCQRSSNTYSTIHGLTPSLHVADPGFLRPRLIRGKPIRAKLLPIHNSLRSTQFKYLC